MPKVKDILTSRYSLLTNYHGFTFIELLIVITTMTLLFGLGFANYRGYQQRQQIISAARLFRGDLRFAQEQALAGIKPAGCDLLNGYKVKNTSSTNYEIDANCDAGNDIVIKSLKINDRYPDIIFKPPLFGFILFNVLGRGVDIPRLVTLQNTRTLEELQINITKGGEVN